MLPPAAYGVTIAMFPLLLINGFIATLMIGKVLEYQTRMFYCDTSVDDKDCPFSLFDSIKDDPNNVEVNYTLLRSGRAGIAFWVVGTYLMFLGLKILIPERVEANSNYLAESFDGNVWEFFTWKRSNVLFISVFWIFYNLMVVQFSFSETFSTYIWYMIGLLKVLGVIFGFILELLLEESLLSSPMEILGGLTQGLVTFGADDFVDFLNAYFIELGIMMFERTYVGDFVDVCVKYIESKIAKMSKFMDFKLGWFSSNDDFLLDKEMQKEKAMQERKKKEQEEAELLREDKDINKDEDKKKDENKEDNDMGSSGSDIYISDDEDDFDFDDSDNLDDSDQLLDYNDSMNEGDKAKPVEKKADELLKANKDDDSDLPIDENIEVQEVEPLLESFKGYANDTIVLFINPLFIALIWVFYDETQVAAEYGIRTQDFLYYFMFSVVIIPFQIVIDVFFQNIVEWYFKLPVHDYLDYLHFRFACRTTRWKGNEEVPNKQVSMNLVSLDQLCFSSQYYFVQTIYSFGMTQLLLGIQILLNFPDYNAFSDNASLIVVVVIVAVWIVIQKLCILLGQMLRIWKVKEHKSNKKELTLKEQFLRILNVDQYMKSQGIKLTPVELHFSKAKWDIVEKLRAQDEVALVDLKTDRIVARTVREKFIKYNKPWLRDNMHEIFTPRTLFLYRKEIINQFEKVVGKKQPVNISLSSKEKSTLSKDISGNSDSVYYKNFKPKKLTEKTKEIIRFWIYNARRSMVNKHQNMMVKKKGY